jgi:hypothetical protein
VFVGFSRIHSIIEMRGSRSKIPSKNPVKQRCAEGFNSNFKGLMVWRWHCFLCPLFSLFACNCCVPVRLIYRSILYTEFLCLSKMAYHKTQQLDFSYWGLLLPWKFTGYFSCFSAFLVISRYLSLFIVISRNFSLFSLFLVISRHFSILLVISRYFRFLYAISSSLYANSTAAAKF